MSVDSKTIQHVAFIMDGNGRWAQRQGMPRLEGHRKGVERVRAILKAAPGLGLTHVTFYAFSTENWKRPLDEVTGLMTLLKWYLKTEISSLKEQGVRLKILGDLGLDNKLGEELTAILKQAEKDTAEGSKLTANFCINYGGRDEIIRAAQAFAADVEKGNRWVGDLDEERFCDYLDTAHQPDPDLILRTGGDQRISNFLLWQAAYAEFVFTETLWPDFTPEDLEEILGNVVKRERRFGGLGAPAPLLDDGEVEAL